MPPTTANRVQLEALIHALAVLSARRPDCARYLAARRLLRAAATAFRYDPGDARRHALKALHTLPSVPDPAPSR